MIAISPLYFIGSVENSIVSLFLFHINACVFLLSKLVFYKSFILFLIRICPCFQVRVTNLQDASEHIGEVLKRVKKEHLERAYKIKDWCVSLFYSFNFNKISCHDSNETF